MGNFAMAGKKKIYIHVGMDKTGTSSIQDFLYRNRDHLESVYNIYYPKTGLWSDHSHHKIPASFLGVFGEKKSNLNSLMKSFQSEIEEKKIVVVSSEIFFKIPFKDDGVEFLKKLTAKFGQVKVIIYIRRQDEWIESRHRHSVLSGSELTLEKLSKPFFSDYSRWINYWANIFGSDNIVLRLFARDKLKKSSLCVDFLNILGVSTADNLPFKELRRNESIGNLELEFMKIHLNLMLGTPINYNLGNVLLAGVGDKTYMEEVR